MPEATRDGVRLYYETEGDGETVAFVPDAGLGAWSWGWQHRAVAGPYEALAWDLRGTGDSDAPPGPYTVPQLAADLEAVLADHGAARAHLVGLGLGGMVALRHALAYGRAASLTLVGTAASGDAVDRDALGAARAPLDDPAALRESLSALLSPAFVADHPDVVDGIAAWRADDDATAAGWEAQVAALDGFDASDRLHEVTEPALVVHGGADRVVPADAGRRLAEALPRGAFEGHEDAGHLVTVERSRPVNDALLEFLDDRARDRS
ncbi:MAG: alpha/beta fold hydrolase [Halobacteriaceae archaeon]